MKITIIKYGKTVNTGDYNSERLDAEAELGEADCPVACMNSLKDFINGKQKDMSIPPKTKTTTEEKVNEDVVLKETPAKKDDKPVKKVAKKAKKVSKKAATASKPKPNVPYSRDEKTHKSTMSDILSEEFPNWKTELLTQAKALSGKLVGTDIYNFKGELLDTFREAIVEGMTADSSDL